MLSFLLGCETTSAFEDFQRLHLGMEKGEVADLVGSPKRNERHEGKDWWYYSFASDKGVLQRMVVFEDGKMVYSGRVTTPAFIKEAEKVDQVHEATTKSLEPETERARVNQNLMPEQPVAPPENPGL